MASATDFGLIITLLLLTAAKDVDSTNLKLESKCPKKDFSYSLGSIFETNLNHTLLEVLPSKVMVKGSWHVGQEIDQVYALYYCLGDVSPQNCHDCVQSAAGTLLKDCNQTKEGIVWYEKCTLRYSNRSMLYLEEEEPHYQPFNFSAQLKTLDQYQTTFDNTMKGLIHQAAFGTGSSSRSSTVVGFAMEEDELSGSGFSLWSLVQCSPDIVGVACETCFSSAIRKMDGWKTPMIFLPSCTVRFGLFPSQIPSKGPRRSTTRIVKFAVPSVIGFLLWVLLLFWLIIHRSQEPATISDSPPSRLPVIDPRLQNQQEAPSRLPAIDPRLQYQVEALEEATNNFSNENKIGEGGFGVVYKGILPDGQEIAVKKLSNISSQGEEEFNTELGLLANVRHRYLVKLLGFCLAGERKLLVYEFMPKKSLDNILFDPQGKEELNWHVRYNIIKGIARGMLYLHQDSPDGIIHRDLKAANVLLDANMEPKICDFGIARVSNFEQTHFTTRHVVGTYGYIAPEYYSTQQFSVKSDVYSFGVLVLEIVSGKRAIEQSGQGVEYLLTYAWKCWEDGNPLKLMDAILEDSCPRDEVIKCVQVGLLCVQEKDKRPQMNSVVHLLDSSNGASGLSNPKPPVYLYIARTGLICPRQIPSQNTFSNFCINFLEHFS